MSRTTSLSRLWIVAFVGLSLALASCGGKPAQPTQSPTQAGQANPGYPAQGGASTPAQQQGYPPAATDTPQVAQAYPAQTGQAEATVNPPTSGGLLLTVVKPDGSTVDVNETSLKALTVQQVTAGNQVVNGYKVVDILKAAGVEQYQQIDIVGASKTATFTPADLPADAILSFTNVGTAELAASTLPADQWLQGVTKIQVK